MGLDLRLIEILVLVIGFYMAWNIGANDVSNAMGTSVGSKALTWKKAAVLAAILEFFGAFFLGDHVAATMQSRLLVVESLPPYDLMVGMCASLLGTGIWLQIASSRGWPVSTTHAIVGSIVGFGAIIGGVQIVNWAEVGFVASSWVVSPLLSGVVSYYTFYFLQRRIFYAVHPIKAARQLYPYLILVFLLTVCGALFFHRSGSVLLKTFSTLAISLVGALLAYLFIRKTKMPEHADKSERLYNPHNVIALYKAVKHLRRVRGTGVDDAKQINNLMKQVKEIADRVKEKTQMAPPITEFQHVEKMFIFLQVMSACFIAFAHGANDVANAIAPVATVLSIIRTGAISDHTAIPSWLLAMGGMGIVIGLATYGYKVIETVGSKITELTPTRGFCAEFGAAATILVATQLGLPISTTHCIVGAVLGVGVAHGISALNLKAVGDIVLSWVITIPASALISMGLYHLLKYLLPFLPC